MPRRNRTSPALLLLAGLVPLALIVFFLLRHTPTPAQPPSPGSSRTAQAAPPTLPSGQPVATIGDDSNTPQPAQAAEQTVGAAGAQPVSFDVAAFTQSFLSATTAYELDRSLESLEAAYALSSDGPDRDVLRPEVLRPLLLLARLLAEQPAAYKDDPNNGVVAVHALLSRVSPSADQGEMLEVSDALAAAVTPDPDTPGRGFTAYAAYIKQRMILLADSGRVAEFRAAAREWQRTDWPRTSSHTRWREGYIARLEARALERSP